MSSSSGNASSNNVTVTPTQQQAAQNFANSVQGTTNTAQPTVQTLQQHNNDIQIQEVSFFHLECYGYIRVCVCVIMYFRNYVYLNNEVLINVIDLID